MKKYEELNREKQSEWEDFYIDFPSLYNILYISKSSSTNRIDSEKYIEIKENNIKNINNELSESLLKNNEEKEKEELNIAKNYAGETLHIIYKKFFRLLILEIEKFSYFDDLLQSTRHRKRFEELNEQLNYIEDKEELYMFLGQLKESYKNFFREITHYQEFIETNLKIKNLALKIFDNYLKLIQVDPKEKLEKYEENIKCINSLCGKSNERNQKFLLEIENQYISIFNNKYLEKNPREELYNYLFPDKEKNDHFYQKRLNYLLIFMTFLIICDILLYRGLKIDMDRDPEFRSIFPMFRSFGIICLYLWTLGINVWSWNDAHINYKALFTFDNNYSSVTEIFTRSAVFSCILFFAIALYMLTRTQYGLNFRLYNYINIEILPGICWLSLLLYFFCPFQLFNYLGRIYSMRLFVECITSLLIPIEFKHIWFMDQLTSLIGPMRDMEYTLCYYSYYVNPFRQRQAFCSSTRGIYLAIAIFPNLIRCLQVGRQIIDNGKCFPYIFNIGKYSFNIIVATFSFLTNFDPHFFIPWLISAFISGCYSSFWDLKMDFGFFENGSINWPLRNHLKYKSRFLLLLSIPIDIVLRFLWMLSISPEIMSQIIRPEFLALILYTLEMLRRGQWNFIRVEYEHLEMMKVYQISYYEELPLIKLTNGQFVANEHNLLNLLNIEKQDKIRLQIKELFNLLEKNPDNTTRNIVSGLSHLKEDKIFEKSIVFDLKNYLTEYNQKKKEIIQ